MAEGEGNSSIGAPDESRQATGISITRLIKIVAIVGLLLIFILLVAALAMSLTAAERWAPLIQIFRDVFLLILILELILVIGALAIFLLQAAGFLIMLKTEIKPIFDNARETTRLSKATAQFLNANAVDPLIQIKSFLAGLLAFLRELIRIRNLVAADESKAEASDETNAP